MLRQNGSHAQAGHGLITLIPQSAPCHTCATHLNHQSLLPCHAGILRQNYRSHASLLSIPNRLFYGDQLQAAADQQALRPPQWAPLRPVQPQQDISQRAEMDEKAVEGELHSCTQVLAPGKKAPSVDEHA